MTPVEIAAQITTLYAQLAELVADEDTEWDGDYATLLTELAEGADKFSTALDAIASKDFESETWDRAWTKVTGLSAEMANVHTGLSYAGELANKFQKELAEGIAAARTEPDTALHTA